MGDIREFQAGWSVARLAEEFGVDRRTATKRIRDAGIAPSGKRNGHDTYRLADVALAMSGITGTAGAEGGVVDPRDLPPMERRAFFQSENERLKVETTVGNLIPALEVEADYAALVKKFVQFLDTLPDVLERKLALRPEQVDKVQEQCDRLRQELYEKIVDDSVRDSA